MHSPKTAAKKHIEMNSRQNTSVKHSRPAQTRAVLCNSNAFTHLRSPRNPAKIRPAVLVIPSTHIHTHRHTHTHTSTADICKLLLKTSVYKSSAVAEMGDRGHNRHGPKGGGCCAPFAERWEPPRLTQCGLRGGLLPYQVASSSILPFGHNSAGCHSLRRNISTNYYFVVEMYTVTVRSDDAWYLLKNSTINLVQNY